MPLGRNAKKPDKNLHAMKTPNHWFVNLFSTACDDLTFTFIIVSKYQGVASEDADSLAQLGCHNDRPAGQVCP